MGSNERAISVDDPVEIEASHRIIRLLAEAASLQQTLESHIEPAPGSRMALDDARLGGYPLSNYAFGQLQVAFGSLEALRSLLVAAESDEHIEFAAGPFGAYTLMRNAIDSAALAAWIMLPGNTKVRVKRLLMAEMEEIDKSKQFRNELNESGGEWAKARRDRMQEVADSAGIPKVNVRNLDLPFTTQILKDLNGGNYGRKVSWLSVWQLCSGHAHGKRWARLATDELQVIPGTETETGSQYRMTVRLALMAGLLARIMDLMRAATDRYVELAAAR